MNKLICQLCKKHIGDTVHDTRIIKETFCVECGKTVYTPIESHSRIDRSKVIKIDWKNYG